MKVLITGGAGFIGSNLAGALLQKEDVSLVRVLDNFSTSKKSNISEYISNPKFELIEGDIVNLDTCNNACEDIDLVSHQAALGSVPRSILDPITSNNVNITGTLNMMYACVKNKISRLVFAASSSTYGDSTDLPKVEDKIGKPLSPYAVTKYVNEIYADVFSKTYNLDYIGLRYFNVFGPKQDPNGSYAAVIPLFMKHAINNITPTINGDGNYSRDFTYIENVIHANIISLFTQDQSAVNQIYNVACGKQTSLNTLWGLIQEVTSSKVNVFHGPERIGDVHHSLADISKIKSKLGYKPSIDLEEGLSKLYKHMISN